MMERGFFHSDLGYWQTIGEPSQGMLDTYPPGTVEVPLKPGSGHEWDGQAWQPPAQAVLDAARREAMQPLEFPKFLAACVDAPALTGGLIPEPIITDAEAKALLKSGTLPAWVQTAIDGVPMPAGKKRVAEYRMLQGVDVHRNSETVAILATAKTPALTPEQVDALFEAGAAL